MGSTTRMSTASSSASGESARGGAPYVKAHAASATHKNCAIVECSHLGRSGETARPFRCAVRGCRARARRECALRRHYALRHPEVAPAEHMPEVMRKSMARIVADGEDEMASDSDANDTRVVIAAEATAEAATARR
jgi:hypothetical protein